MTLGNPTDPSTFILDEPFAPATCPFDYVLKSSRFDSLSLSSHANSIDN